METLSFAFGVLTVIGVVFAAVVVVGIVKVFKMEKRLTNSERWIDEVRKDVHNRISDEVREVNQRVDQLNSYVDSQFNEHGKEINNRVDHLNSYVDSRLDKLESKFIGNSAKKQIIND